MAADANFRDANGAVIEVGTMVKYHDARFAKVIAISNDGVGIEFLDGERWRTGVNLVTALPPEVVAQLKAENEREYARQAKQHDAAPATPGKYESLTYDEAKTLARHRVSVLINDLEIRQPGWLPSDLEKARRDLADIAELIEQAYKEVSKP